MLKIRSQLEWISLNNEPNKKRRTSSPVYSWQFKKNTNLTLNEEEPIATITLTPQSQGWLRFQISGHSEINLISHLEADNQTIYREKSQTVEEIPFHLDREPRNLELKIWLESGKITKTRLFSLSFFEYLDLPKTDSLNNKSIYPYKIPDNEITFSAFSKDELIWLVKAFVMGYANFQKIWTNVENCQATLHPQDIRQILDKFPNPIQNFIKDEGDCSDSNLVYQELVSFKEYLEGEIRQINQTLKDLEKFFQKQSGEIPNPEDYHQFWNDLVENRLDQSLSNFD